MNPVTALSLGRIAVGVASIAQPRLVGTRLTGAAPTSDLIVQWFGTREIALGAATLLASGTARRNLVLIGVLVDGADAVTSYAGVEAEQLPREIGLLGTAVASVAAVAGLLGLRVKKRRPVLESV